MPALPLFTQSLTMFFSKIYFSIAKTHEQVASFLTNFSTAVYCNIKVIGMLALQTHRKGMQVTKRFHKDYSNTKWNQLYYNISGVNSDYYVPEDLFYVNIEQKLNSSVHYNFVADKNCLDRLRLPCKFPKAIGRVMKGNFLDVNYKKADPDAILSTYPKVILKPSQVSGGGVGVRLVTGPEAAAFVKKTLSSGSKLEYIIQEPVQPAPELTNFSPDAVTTMRINTLYFNNKASHIATVIRMGRKGVNVDNLGQGGMSAGVDKQGRVDGTAYDELLKPFKRHPDTGFVFKDFQVPAYDKAIELCLKLQSLLPEIGIIAWDVTIDKDYQPVIIEINTRWQEINFHQLVHGPLFGDQLPEILAKTKPRFFLGLPVA